MITFNDVPAMHITIYLFWIYYISNMSNIGAHQDNINTTVIKEMYDILQESKEDLSTIKYHYVKPV